MASQKTYESLVVVAAKMWGVKADRRAASEFISSNVKTTGAETSELVQKLKGTAENNFEGVQVRHTHNEWFVFCFFGGSASIHPEGSL